MRYAPDGDKSNPELLYQISNLYSNNNGALTRTPALVAATTTALTTGRVLGSGIVKNLAGTAKLYAGSTTKVYQANGTGGWTDRSGAVTFAATVWDFCAFGDSVIAANGASKVQAATTGNFADIAQAPTGAKIVFPHANALVALNTTADGAAWHRSVSGSSSTWTPAANNDADTGTLYGGIGGPIVAGGPWENLALAWKARSMYAARYVGASDPDQPVLDWQIVSTDVGCVSQFAHVSTEVGEVFVSERGIMLFNGNKPYNIDDDIRKTFMAEAMPNRSRIFCTLDEGNNQVYVWISPSGTDYCGQAYIWNYKTGLWGHLTDLSDKTALTIGLPRTPVRNANYQDLVAIGGFATNDQENANLFFEHTGDYLLALTGAVWLVNDGEILIRSGFLGRYEVDSTITRIHVISDAFTSLSSLVCNVYMYTSDKLVVTSTGSISLTNGAYFDVHKTARYFELQISSTASTTSLPIQRVVVEFYDVQTKKTSSLEL